MTALVDWRLCGDRPQVIDRSDYGDTSDWDFDIRCGDVRVAVGVCAKCLTPTATINTWRANSGYVDSRPSLGSAWPDPKPMNGGTNLAL